MEDKIRKILDELYMIDESFKEKEIELSKIIEKLLRDRPDIKIDKSFVENLRSELLSKHATKNSFNFNFMKKFAYSFTGFVVALIIAVPTIFYYQSHKGLVGDLAQKESAGTSEVGKLAFGDLGQSVRDALKNQRPQGGGGGGGGYGAAMGSGIAMPAPEGDFTRPTYEMIFYRYSYKGDDVNLTETEMPVYKKIHQIDVGAGVADVLKNATSGLMDLSSLSNVKLGQFTLYEDKDVGYYVSVDFANGNISINKNYKKPLYECQDQACYDAHRLKMSDIPEDANSIAMADSFLKTLNIDMSSYGPGEVDSRWRRSYEASDNKADFYPPEWISVIYPLMINGYPVYDVGGNKYGLNVNIEVRTKSVSAVYNINIQKYLSSTYSTETDFNKILELEQKGGTRYYYDPYARASGFKDIETGTPHLAYLQRYEYKNQENEELFIPALAFPITKYPEDEPYFDGQYVIVPLAKDILNAYGETPDIYPPIPVPLTK